MERILVLEPDQSGCESRFSYTREQAVCTSCRILGTERHHSILVSSVEKKLGPTDHLPHRLGRRMK